MGPTREERPKRSQHPGVPVQDGAPGPRLATSTFAALGVIVSVLTVDPKALGPAEAQLRAALGELDRTCSRFRPDSEISKVGASGGRPVPISPLLWELISAATKVAEATGGAVDPTVGAAVAALGYDRDWTNVVTSGPSLQSAAVPAPGWRCLELDAERRTLRVPEGVALDLGSSAKAYAADRAAAGIARSLGTGVLVNLAGDIAVAGDAPEGGWPIGLALDSSTPPEQTTTVVSISSGGMASSGTAVRTWRRGGRELHHIVDPRTGDVALSPWVLVTAAASSCLMANAASTAAIVMGEPGLEWLRERGLPARLVRQAGGVEISGGWPTNV
jgi:thiamine biosynthesis lipoprotein